MDSLLFYCRPGFEQDLASEVSIKASYLDIYGYPKFDKDSGLVQFECYQEEDAGKFAQNVDFNALIFARQMIVITHTFNELDRQDRLSPILDVLKKQGKIFSEVWVETADTNDAKSLATFCRKFTVPLRQALKKSSLYNERWSNLTLHLCFVESNSCFLGYSFNKNHSSQFMGITRLRFPSDAPSRSTLKLEEAIHTFIPKNQQNDRLREGMCGVDLGACPGGWSYQLVKRGVYVYGVDHGQIADSLLSTGLIEHCPEDGFHFKPPRRTPITWLVCDMVEKPKRITTLMAKWIVNRWCREVIFNLKLPMKKRYQEVQECIDILEKELKLNQFKYKIQAKQLYHDREEVTVHVQILSN